MSDQDTPVNLAEITSILDQLNGMVIAGEVALETLQRAGERRVAESGRTFMNHYELGAHLGRVGPKLDEPIADVGLGRVDLLFALVRKLGIGTPSQLTPYLEALHGNLEIRPLAEQFIDAILAEDESRYDVYRTIQEEIGRRDTEGEFSDSDMYHQIGLFMARWADLEGLIRRITPAGDLSEHTTPFFRLIGKLDLLDADIRQEVDLLRRIRNNVVHSREVPPAGYLAKATQRLESITEEIKRRIQQKEQ